MAESGKSRSRRAEIRKNRPDAAWLDIEALRSSGVLTSLGIAAFFFVAATAILSLREQVVPYRPGQWIPHDIVSRVDFSYRNKDRLADMRRDRRDAEPRVYQPLALGQGNGDAWGNLRHELTLLPDKVSDKSAGDLPAPLKSILDGGAMTALRQYASPPARETYTQKVNAFVDALQSRVVRANGQQWKLIVLPKEERQKDLEAGRAVAIEGYGVVPSELTFAADTPEFRAELSKLAADYFLLSLQPQMIDLTVAILSERPTHVYNDAATNEARNIAEGRITAEQARVKYPANSILVPRSKLKFEDADWDLLRAENEAYRQTLGQYALKSHLGLLMTVAIMTAVLSLYVGFYQPRVIRNHPRAVAIMGLLLSMLLVAQVAAIGHGPLFLFGIAPTLLVALILTIAYDRRFAIGVASMHAFLVTFGLGQGIDFFLIIWVGVLAVGFLLDDIRTRSKLIEVGGAAALAMIVAAVAAGALSLDPWAFVLKNCLYTGAAGLVVGFVVLGILPF